MSAGTIRRSVLCRLLGRMLTLILLLLPSVAGASLMDQAASRGRIEEIVDMLAEIYEVDPMLVMAVIEAESSFNQRAVSPKGAVGLMQVIPSTAERFGIERHRGQTMAQTLTDPFANILAGTLYLAYLNEKFEEDPELVLAAYNAGEGAVMKYQYQVPPYPETQHYVRKVMRRYSLLAGLDE